MINAANLAWGNFPLLSHGAIEALKQHGEAWQHDAFLKPLIEGRWTGTMCLTEPHCGTDLGLLKTKAEPNADGSYSITGTKIFITAGEHDLTGNIVHLVLAAARRPSGRQGHLAVRHPEVQGRPRWQRRRAQCTALWLDRTQDGHQGVGHLRDELRWCAGLPGRPAAQGLQAMFTMMNTARLGVGLQGIGLSERAYQNALKYSRERLQSRALSGARFPDKPADPILVHRTCVACC